MSGHTEIIEEELYNIPIDCHESELLISCLRDAVRTLTDVVEPDTTHLGIIKKLCDGTLGLIRLRLEGKIPL